MLLVSPTLPNNFTVLWHIFFIVFKAPGLLMHFYGFLLLLGNTTSMVLMLLFNPTILTRDIFWFNMLLNKAQSTVYNGSGFCTNLGISFRNLFTNFVSQHCTALLFRLAIQNKLEHLRVKCRRAAVIMAKECNRDRMQS